ncbi:MAG TPA: CGNR zinc finger domain-containing protein [Gemmatimonadales bacterium]|nr:CGNR zinc finger domain-containing protein [Gemmatimonadales bacterium]
MSGAGSLALISGHLVLDFANTAGWHASDHRNEWLTGYGDCIAWARHAAGLSAKEATTLLQFADKHPGKTQQAFTKVLQLREADYRVFAALSQGRLPAQADLDQLHAARIAALEAAHFAPGPDGRPVLGWRPESADLLRPFYPIIVAATDLLGADDLKRLRQCGNHPCGWLFLDRSRNGSRRWCSSTECGNATRVRRFRAKQTSN